MKFISIFLISWFIFGVSFFARASHPILRNKGLFSGEDLIQSIKDIKKIKPKTKEREDLKQFGLGVYHFFSGDLKTARKNLLRKNPLYKDYATYLLGAIFLSEKKWSKVHRTLRPLLTKKDLPAALRNRALFMVSKSHLEAHRWGVARKYFKRLEKKWRHNKRHPEVLWFLVKAERELNHKRQSCLWARKLYSRYPSHELIYDWALDLKKAKFEGKPLGCVATLTDREKRVRRLQREGESDRAKGELDKLQAEAVDKDAYKIDRLKASYLIDEGYVYRAFALLMSNYSKKKNDVKYLRLLSKAASKAGELQTATGSYYRVYKLRPRTKVGRQALFSSAFLSYQFKNYNGARRKFKELIYKFPRSGLSRDAMYHLAWIRYLNADYKGAIRDFKKILKKKQMYKRKWWKYSEERIEYWLAMSYYRLRKFKLAKPIFRKLMSDPLLGYYSLVAQHRYNSIAGSAFISRVKNGIFQSIQAIEPIASLPKKNNSRKVSSVTRLIVPSNLQENESEENINISDTFTELSDLNSFWAYEGAKEKKQPLVVRPRYIVDHIRRAQGFLNLGLKEWAFWELKRIEKSSKSPIQMQNLIDIYQELGRYNRSSLIGQFFFARKREELGLNAANKFWKVSYPRAYASSVEFLSNKFKIDSEFIWGIMKAESGFDQDVVSPVGARGLMQIMPQTARRVSYLIGGYNFQVPQLFRPKVNIALGTRYLKRLFKKFDGQYPLVAAAYNAGPHRVESWLESFGQLDLDEFIEHIPFIETRNYTKRVLRYFGIYKLLYQKNDRALASLSSAILDGTYKQKARETWELIED